MEAFTGGGINTEEAAECATEKGRKRETTVAPQRWNIRSESAPDNESESNESSIHECSVASALANFL